MPRPSNVRQLGKNFPLVTFQQGNMTVVMDRDAFDYTYGDADGPDPAQRDLDALLPKVTRVCVLEGAMLRGRAMSGSVLADLSDTTAIQDLASCLRIVEDPQTFGHCHCLGGPTLELYAGLELVATIGLQHGKAIRWKQWVHDAQLQDSVRLTRWLQDHGVDPAQLQEIYGRGDNFLFAEPSLSEGQKAAQQTTSEARQRAQEGKLAEALELCHQALALDPDDAELYALRGRVHCHLGRLPEAAADCTAAIDRGLRHAEICCIRAVALESAGRMEEALADCAMALHLDPECAPAHNSRGLIRVGLNQLEDALGDFTEAIRLAPKWFLPRLHLAQCHYSRGELDAALAAFDRAFDLVKESPPSQGAAENETTLALMHCRRGEIRYDQFCEEEAEADFSEARRRDAAATAGYMGDLWLRRGKYELALASISQLVQLHPQHAPGYIGRGAAQEALGDLDLAVADYSAAIRLQPDGGVGFALRAQVRRKQGRLDDALADLSQHLRLHPDDPMARVSRAALHKQQGAVAEAFADLNAAHRAAPNDPLVCNNLAWMLATCPDAQLRDGSRAVALARQACQATEWRQSFCLGTLGAAYAEIGAFDQAARWQSEAIDLYPEEEKPAGQARLELYRARQRYRE